MKMTPDEIDRARKQFFNDHADHWIELWYKDQPTGRCDKHQKDFERLFSLLPLNRGDRVLDAGCGAGVLVPYIMDRITSSGMLYELDYAEKMLEFNRVRNARDNIRFIVSEVEDIPLDDNACDAAICFSCFPHFRDKERAVGELSRILRPDGVLAISHFDSSDGINRHHRSCHAVMHDRLPDESAMRSLLEGAGLAVHESVDEPGFYCMIAEK